MKLFNRSKHDCTGVCELYKAPKTTTAEGVINQFKCDNCNHYLFPNGILSAYGDKICKCCSTKVVYIESIKDDPDVKETKKSIPNSFIKNTFGRKTFEQFLEFLENKIQLQANYQLVVLKFLIGNKMSQKIEIAEELAYQNNKNFNDSNEVKKFLLVPVYDVLENRGYIKKIIHNDEEQYMLNIEMNEFEVTRSIEILEKKISEYNLEHNIPENQFDNILNEVKVVKEKASNSNEIVIESENKDESIMIKQTDHSSSINETIVVVKNSSNGILLKEFSETKSEELHKGQILSNDNLMDKFNVGNMGGIRYSKKNNILVLCSSLSKDYADSLDPNSGLIVYSGEGQTGDQELTKGNQKILDSENKILYFKEKYQEPGSRKRGALDNLYEFVGLVKYVKYYWNDEKDKEGNPRKVVKFVLEVES